MAAFPVSVSRRWVAGALALTGKAAVPAARRRDAAATSLSAVRSVMNASGGGWIRVSGLPSARSAQRIMAIRPQHNRTSAETDGGARNAQSHPPERAANRFPSPYFLAILLA